MIPIVVAQLFTTPAPIFTATPAPLSERAALEARLVPVAAHAHRLGATLGVVVYDTGTGALATRNDGVMMPMGSLQTLAVALATYERVDRHQFTLAEVRVLLQRALGRGDDAASATLLQMLGGAASVNTALRADGLNEIEVAANDGGTATPRGLATLIARVIHGNLLSSASRDAMLGLLAQRDETRMTIDGHTFTAIVMLRGSHAGASERAALRAEVRQAIADVTKLFPLQ